MANRIILSSLAIFSLVLLNSCKQKHFDSPGTVENNKVMMEAIRLSFIDDPDQKIFRIMKDILSDDTEVIRIAFSEIKTLIYEDISYSSLKSLVPIIIWAINRHPFLKFEGMATIGYIADNDVIAINYLHKILENSSDSEETIYANMALAMISESCDEYVEQIINSVNSEIVQGSIEGMCLLKIVLRKDKCEEAISDYAATLIANEYPVVRGYAAEILGESGSEGMKYESQLERQLDNENDEFVKIKMNYAFAIMSEDKSNHVLEIGKYLHNDDYAIRRTALVALRNLGSLSSYAIEDLMYALRNEEKNIMVFLALQTLSYIEQLPDEIVNEVCLMLNNVNNSPKTEIIILLGRANNDNALKCLKEAENDKDEVVRYLAKQYRKLKENSRESN